jgi:hypothetical protein
VRAVEAGTFHVYPIARIDEGLRVLTGIVAGERDAKGKFPEGTINSRVERRLVKFAEHARAFGTGKPGRERGKGKSE